MERVVLTHCLRPELTIEAIKLWLESVGKFYTESIEFGFASKMEEVDHKTPLLLIAMPGAEPYREFVAFAKGRGMGKRYENISLGQGQGEKAEQLIKQGISKGFWILLENCHLGRSWLPTLQILISGLE